MIAKRLLRSITFSGLRHRTLAALDLATHGCMDMAGQHLQAITNDGGALLKDIAGDLVSSLPPAQLPTL